ncbi:hypothetical protein BU26DRAFT_525017 [Trematosphaeria pertusa]|uniref:DUF7924 domain-containing protein n=1 Tax=Trematosphaeria pertusa TaxID=390896 RepID=A0A6A6HV52_9PLEO|nr:uncharacterized protein BU26DRAFT_525017 [Trematosphaeria pertusa]KAF2241907.1 hypothetical protein BU26DRAFT_525017 [Trematosphaeria pertusa]
MKRAASACEDGTARKRCRRASTSTPLESFDPVQWLEWAERARSISAWACSVASNPPRSDSCNSCESPPASEAEVPDTMSESSRLRDMKTAQRARPRSCSPTKKSSQYRNIVLKPANILVDVIHVLPPDVEALLPSDLRDILDPPSHAPPSSPRTHADAATATHNENAEEENNARTRELADRVRELAAVYLFECRLLAGKPGSEPEYRTHLYSDVVEKLARIPAWCRVLSASCSDKLWRASLKPAPPNPILALPSSTWPSLPPNPIVAAKPPQGASFESTPNTLDSDVVRIRPDGRAFNFAGPPASTAPSESSTASELDGTLTTPKPDITVGISREAFSRAHAGLLEYWQAKETVVSDPHATQGDMRFPFLIIEGKGLVTNGNLIGAQNQAAGGRTCAIRVLESLAEQDPDPAADGPRIVFSVTTEGVIHELWVHYRVVDEDDVVKHHMTCLGAWRSTLERHTNELVAALACILEWGVEVFHGQVRQVLDRVLANAVAVQ